MLQRGSRCRKEVISGTEVLEGHAFNNVPPAPKLTVLVLSSLTGRCAVVERNRAGEERLA